MNIPFGNVEKCESQITMQTKVSSKKGYWLLVKEVVTMPTCINSWNAKGVFLMMKYGRHYFCYQNSPLLILKLQCYNIKFFTESMHRKVKYQSL